MGDIGGIILGGVALVVGVAAGLYISRQAIASSDERAVFFAEQWAHAEAALRHPACDTCGDHDIYQIIPTPERGLVCYCKDHADLCEDTDEDDDRDAGGDAGGDVGADAGGDLEDRLLRNPDAWKDA